MKHEKFKNLKYLKIFIIVLCYMQTLFCMKLEPGTPMISSHNQNLRKTVKWNKIKILKKNFLKKKTISRN